MNGFNADKVELIKWWDTLDVITERHDLDKGLEMARDCQKEDAAWLARLFPPGAVVTRETIVEVMEAEGDDPRALHLLWEFREKRWDGGEDDVTLLRRAAEMGYAPAQSSLCLQSRGREAFMWAEKAAAQGARLGLCRLAECFANYYNCLGCERNLDKAIAAYKQAAKLGDVTAQMQVGELAFGELDWERYRWWGRAAARGWRGTTIINSVSRLLVYFKQGQLGRVLFEIAPACKAHLDVSNQRAFGCYVSEELWEGLLFVIALFEARCKLAKRAIDCWSIVGLRLGVEKDIRVMIAQIAWEHRWMWGEAAKLAQVQYI